MIFRLKPSAFKVSRKRFHVNRDLRKTIPVVLDVKEPKFEG